MDPYRHARAEKAARLRAAGHDPYGRTFQTSHSIAQARALAPPPALDGAQQCDGVELRLAGRIGNLRKAGGKLVFATLFDRSRAELLLEQRRAARPELDGAEASKERGIQLFLERGALGEAAWSVVACLDLADWVGVEGRIGRTRTGEITCFVATITVLGKSALPPPHQVGAARDELSPELRQRHRELDLMMSDASLATVVLRSRLVAETRRFFEARGFLEVETPILHGVLGGAAARPFRTHHNALAADFYLRIAPELHLKRLIVGGLERVFEIGRNFRNEGLSPRHNPEFTMIEWYQAYADHWQMMGLTEDLLRQLADRLLGSRRLRFLGHELDLERPFQRLDYGEALRELAGLDGADVPAITAAARELGMDPDSFASHPRLANAVWEALVEPHLQQPTFIYGQPSWLTPLCRSDPDDPNRSMRFELFIAGMEFGNAYSELNDPEQQRSRFAEQLREAQEACDDEAGVADGRIDEDYCRALDHGLPCCGGQGMGIDRLAMLYAGADSIRDVILFPAMRSRVQA